MHDEDGFHPVREQTRVLTHDNTLIDIHMLEASRVNGIRRFLYTSSACVYPRRLQERVDVAPIREEQAYPAEAEDGYGWQKLIIERLCRHYREDYGLRTYVARLHNIFGPSGEWRGGREKSPAAICRRVALASSDEWIEVWGDGMQTRSYCYISDCIRGIYLLMQSEHCDPVNIGQDRLVSINELVDIVATIARKSIGKRHDLGKPQGVRGRNADISVMRTVTGWKPEVSLEEGLERTYSWVIDQVRKSQRERAEQAVLGAAVELRKAVSMALGDLADLIDRLCIVNLKIWHLEEAIRDNSKPDEEIGRLTRTLTPLNEQRATLKNRINELTALVSKMIRSMEVASPQATMMIN